jgi:hypothetical protein
MIDASSDFFGEGLHAPGNRSGLRNDADFGGFVREAP